MTVFPADMAGITRERNPSSGASAGQITPTVPTGSFMASATLRNGGLCTAPSDGAVHNPPFRNVALAMKEPVGTVGVICPADAPLLGFLSLVMPAISAGNTVIAIASEKFPLITGDLYQVFETSDLPDGVVNIVTGRTAELMKTLAEHDDVNAIWCFTDEASAAAVKLLSVGNLKQVFSNEGRAIDWFNVKQGEGRWFLDHAVQVKNIWVPYGE